MAVAQRKQINNELRAEWNKKFAAVNKQNINKGKFIVQLSGVDISCDITHTKSTSNLEKQQFTFPDDRTITFDNFPMNHYSIANCVLQYVKSYNYSLETMIIKKELEAALSSIDSKTRNMILESLIKNGTSQEEKKNILKDILAFDHMASVANFKTDKVNLGKEIKSSLYILRDSLKTNLPNIDVIVNRIDERLSGINDGVTLNTLYTNYYSTRPRTFFTLIRCLCIIIHPHITYAKKKKVNNNGISLGAVAGNILDTVITT